MSALAPLVGLSGHRSASSIYEYTPEPRGSPAAGSPRSCACADQGRDVIVHACEPFGAAPFQRALCSTLAQVSSLRPDQTLSGHAPGTETAASERRTPFAVTY